MARSKRTTGSAEPEKELVEVATALDLTALAERVGDLLRKAEQLAPSYTDFTLELLNVELDARRQRRHARNRKRSRLRERVEGLEDYDFTLRPKLEARVVRELLNCRWVGEGRNLICVGRPGLGKTRVLDALADAALRLGHTVLHTTAAEMLEDLHAALADGSYRRAFRRYLKPEVLYVDEFGYAPFDVEATNYLFRLVAQRHDARAPILLAANTGFKRWASFFPNEAQAVATVDRLIDRATILRFSGKSFRRPQDLLGEDDPDPT